MSDNLTVSAEETLTAKINAKNETTYLASELIFGNPLPWDERGRDTKVEVALATAPTVFEAVYYKRADLGQFFSTPPVVEDVGYTSTLDLLTYLNATFSLGLTAADIVNEPIDSSGGFPHFTIVKVAPTSLRYIGVFSITLVNEIPNV